MVKYANYSIQKVCKTAMIMFLLFFCNPFIAYLVFKGKGALEVTYSLLLQIYGYSFAVFIPVTFAYILAEPFYNLRVFILLCSAGISLYYLYKESREYIGKYLDDKTFKQIGGYIALSNVLFILLFRYYFISGWWQNIWLIN